LLNSMRLLAFDRASTNRTMMRLRKAADAFEGWLKRASFDGFLHAIGHRWKAISGALFGIVLFAWLCTCFAQINNGEVGVVQRFAEVKRDLPPGLHIRWPWPVETVTRVRPDEIRTVEIGFRIVEKQGAGRSGNMWTSAHGDGIAPITDESVMVTGDGDLVDI